MHEVMDLIPIEPQTYQHFSNLCIFENAAQAVLSAACARGRSIEPGNTSPSSSFAVSISVMSCKPSVSVASSEKERLRLHYKTPSQARSFTVLSNKITVTTLPTFRA